MTSYTITVKKNCTVYKVNRKIFMTLKGACSEYAKLRIWQKGRMVEKFRVSFNECSEFDATIDHCEACMNKHRYKQLKQRYARLIRNYIERTAS